MKTEKQILESYTYDIEKALWYENKQGKQISKTLLAEIYELGFIEAQKETLKWWISAFEQGAYTEKEALELMIDQIEALETNKTSKENE